MSEEKVEELKKKIEELKKQLEETEKLKEEYLNGWKRARADLLNYKMEELERMEKVKEKVREKLFFEFLPVLDSFDRAEKLISEKERGNNSIQGLLQIKKQILEWLKKYGVERMECKGEKFNPLYHEVVEEVDTDEYETGVIIEEVEKGYKIGNNILRPAKVKVAK
jgi:molecular chaperone GrpE